MYDDHTPEELYLIVSDQLEQIRREIHGPRLTRTQRLALIALELDHVQDLIREENAQR
mgnify:CR=1 FL=1